MSRSKSETEIAELSGKNAPHFVKKRKCRIEGCDRNVNPSRAKIYDYRCSYHFDKASLERRPVLIAAKRLKHNAAQRNIPHCVSRRHWMYLNYFTFYWEKKGRTHQSLTIDRIDNGKGYSDDNVQVVDMSYNSKKGKGKDWWED